MVGINRCYSNVQKQVLLAVKCHVVAVEYSLLCDVSYDNLY